MVDFKNNLKTTKTIERVIKMARESFIFYASFYEGMKYLDEANYNAVSRAVNEYALYGNEIKLEGIANGFFQLIKPQLDANIRRRENGMKGGAPMGNSNSKKKSEMPELDFENNPKQPMVDSKNNQKQPNVNVNDNVNVNVNDNFLESENSAVADATTQTNRVSDDVLADSIENSASPKEKEKSSAKKEKEPAPAKKPIEERHLDFWQEIEQHKDKYDCEMLQAFYNYWGEYNEGGKKMRWEMQPTWNLAGRLATWAKREAFINRRPTYTQPAPSDIKAPDYYPQHDDSDQF